MRLSQSLILAGALIAASPALAQDNAAAPGNTVSTEGVDANIAANDVQAGTLASAPDLNGIYDLRELNKVLVAAGKPPVSAADLGQE